MPTQTRSLTHKSIYVCHARPSIKADILIPEYLEGSSNNKAVELYNSANPVRSY